jgi:hypothetical protein
VQRHAAVGPFGAVAVDRGHHVEERLGPEEEAVARPAGAAHEHQRVGQRRRLLAGLRAELERAALRREPGRDRDPLDER